MKKQKKENNWRYKTIENLEKRNYGDPADAPTNLVRRCLELCRTPLDEFTTEDLRLMIGQQLAPVYLVPLALEHLQQDIFAEGRYFPGDLLKNVLAIDAHFWKEYPELWYQLNELIKDRWNELASHRISLTAFYSAL